MCFQIFRIDQLIRKLYTCFEKNFALRAIDLISCIKSHLKEGGVSDLHYYTKKASFTTQYLYVTFPEIAGEGFIST